MPIPIIDLFAGPGGLGEGFSALRREGLSTFKIKLSIEKDEHAHRTLLLRAFFRQFPHREAPEAYYDYLAGTITREQLFKKFPAQSERAKTEAWHAQLGGKDFPSEEIDARIRDALNKRSNWLLIGGPPCQAYSLVGRSRRMNDPAFAADEKHLLYKQYLRILAVHKPPVFVMENVKGLLSAKVNDLGILDRILSDLENPVESVFGLASQYKTIRYRLVSLVTRGGNLMGKCEGKDFVVCAEKYGIPQARHRIILLGISTENKVQPSLLKAGTQMAIEDVIDDLPRLRSGLSKEFDSAEAWHSALMEIKEAAWLHEEPVNDELRRMVAVHLRAVSTSLVRGSEFIPRNRHPNPSKLSHWFADSRLQGVSNHSTRSHIREDLHRYFFASAFAKVKNRSPLLEDFPISLLPLHKNVAEGISGQKFNDRFRVQVEGRPSTTVTSHISKDGHYYVHYDPSQCRSLTVREAARLQTFPDNYFFEGARTQQYQQVGNAVPPLLAYRIAKIVAELFA